MSQIPELFSKLPGWQQIAWILWGICGLLLLATALITTGRQARPSTVPPAVGTVTAISTTDHGANPALVFVQVPPSTGGPLAGQVRNIANPERLKVVVYAQTDKWYVQPNIQESMTPIQPDGSWKSWTRDGTHFAVLIVNPAYVVHSPVDAPPVTGSDVVVAAVESATALKESP